MKKLIPILLTTSMFLACSQPAESGETTNQTETSPQTEQNQAEENSNSASPKIEPFCLQVGQPVKFELGLEMSGGEFSPLSLEEADPNNEKQVIRIEGSDDLHGWWSLEDWSGDGLKDLVWQDAASVGSSGEGQHHFVMQCPDGTFQEVLVEYAEDYWVVDAEKGQPRIVLISPPYFDPAAGNPGPMIPVGSSFSIENGAFVRDGGKFEKWSKNLLVGFSGELPTHTEIYENKDDFKSVLVAQEGSNFEVKLENGETWKLEGVDESEVDENTTSNKFLHYYPEQKLVAFGITYWEDYKVLLLDLKDGSEHFLPSFPVFSHDMKHFVTVQGNLDMPEIKRQIALWSFADGIEQVGETLIPERGMLTNLSWSKADGLRGILEELEENGDLKETGVQLYFSDDWLK